MSHKMGFWSVFAIVTGSQIGSGIFLLPANLAPFGYFALLGWIISACGAIALSLVFASLCSWFPQTGGPHVYVRQAFGPTAAFFTGWTYWVISWVSSTVVVIASISFLTPFIGVQSPFVYFMLEVLLLLAIMFLNLRGVKTAGGAEFFLTILKFVPLLIMPLVALWFFNGNNVMVDDSVAHLNVFQMLGRTVLLTMWGFIGVESATAPAGSVENPSRTIPLAVVAGTFCVAFLYILNSIGIMGLIPGNVLMESKAPYVDAAQFLFGGSWHYLLSILGSLVCIGTLNAWVLTSSQVALGLAQDKFLPRSFGIMNQYDAPVKGLFISCLGMVPLLFLTMNENLAQQVTDIIDFSVTAFLFVYLICSIGYLKLVLQRGEGAKIFAWLYGIFAVAFCSWILYSTPITVLGIASLFVLSGLPLYFFWYRK